MKTQAAAGAVGVGIAGLGRSGWKIHAETISQMSDRFRVAAAVDARPERQAEARARFGCAVSADVESLNRDPAVELVVIATPNHLHVQQAIAAMEAGKHVLCEKPFAMSAEEAKKVIAASQRTGRVLAIYQNRRFDPHFQKVQEIVQSGILGRIVQIRFAVHSFSRRWDWQTLKEFGGGTLNNMGAHFLDQLLVFFDGVMPAVDCFTDRALTLGDAEDHCVVTLRAPGKPLVQMELSSACAYPQENWLIMGTHGTLRGWFDRLEWRVAQFEQLPARVLDREPMADRSYNSEKIPWNDFTWTAAPEETTGRHTHQLFYANLYDTLRHGAKLVVTPEQVLKQMQVFDACRERHG